MAKQIESKIGSTICARINAVHMSEAERQRALNALYDAEMLVDGILWVARKIESAAERLFLKPAQPQA